MTRPAFALCFILCGLCGAFAAGCAVPLANNAAAPQTVTIKSSAKNAAEPKSVGGGALYTFRYESKVSAIKPGPPDPDAPVGETALAVEDEDDDTTDTTDAPSAAACPESAACGCDTRRDGEAGLVFYPEADGLRVEWKQMRGVPGPFDVGALKRDNNGLWRLAAEPARPGAICFVENVESDALDRFIAFTLRCESQDEEQACRVLESLYVRFVSPLDAPPQSVPFKEFPLIEEPSKS